MRRARRAAAPRALLLAALLLLSLAGGAHGYAKARSRSLAWRAAAALRLRLTRGAATRRRGAPSGTARAPALTYWCGTGSAMAAQALR
jgi:hypothetical protein